jgi:hypothetical protein
VQFAKMVSGLMGAVIFIVSPPFYLLPHQPLNLGWFEFD